MLLDLTSVMSWEYSEVFPGEDFWHVCLSVSSGSHRASMAWCSLGKDENMGFARVVHKVTSHPLFLGKGHVRVVKNVIGLCQAPCPNWSTLLMACCLS